MEAYSALDFKWNIIASNLQSEKFEVHMNSTLHPAKSCMLFEKGSLDMRNGIWEAKFINGFYR